MKDYYNAEKISSSNSSSSFLKILSDFNSSNSSREKCPLVGETTKLLLLLLKQRHINMGVRETNARLTRLILCNTTSCRRTRIVRRKISEGLRF